MAHRDDHQAALLRAASLERELAETKEALAEKERILVDREADIADRNADAEREARATDAASKTTAREDAEAELDDLRRRGAEAADKAKDEDERQRAQAIESEDQEEQRRTKVRVIRSSSLPGAMFAWETVFFGVPLFGFSLVMLSRFPMRWSLGAAGCAVATLFFFAYIYPPIRAKQLPRWLAALPYAVPGYVALLARRAPKKDECTLVVILEFAGSPPADLANLMKAVDVTLEPAGDNRFRRAFPISVHRSKHGTRWENHDSNLPLHRWFSKLERRVLRPVHALHPISTVKLLRETSKKRFPFR